MAWNTGVLRQVRGYSLYAQGLLCRIKENEDNAAVICSAGCTAPVLGVVQEPNFEGQTVGVAVGKGDKVMVIAESAIKAGDMLKCSATTAGYVEKTTTASEAVLTAVTSASNKEELLEAIIL